MTTRLDPFTILAQEMAGEKVRARRAEDRLHHLETMLDDLQMTLWRTDADLRLVAAHGLVAAECFLGRSIVEFYRDVYGLDEHDAPPVAAHRDALTGEGGSLTLQQDGRLYALFIEPTRDERGEVSGTVGMGLLWLTGVGG